jgi:acetate CoA/acetoacetate CoA-transferase alpha subunit
MQAINKIKTADEAISIIHNGATIMIGGFLSCGTPEILIDAIISKGIKNLTVIVNDAAFPGCGVGKLVTAGSIKKLIASHIGLNSEITQNMKNKSSKNTIEYELIPQGTLAERIRAGGSGIAGFLTATGIGTLAAKNKKIISLNGRKYILEMPLKADFALIGGHISDTFGNTIYNGTARNFNPLMATAAKHTIVSSKKIVEAGSLDPNNIITPGIFIDSIVQG